MTDTYQELLVQRKPSQINKIMGFTLVGLAVLSVISAIFVSLFFFIGAVVCGVISYVIYFRRTVVEFEYTYMDKELRVDRIYNQSKRKQVDVFDLNKTEIIAPDDSFHLDNYKNRDVIVSDYSTDGMDTTAISISSSARSFCASSAIFTSEPVAITTAFAISFAGLST